MEEKETALNELEQKKKDYEQYGTTKPADELITDSLTGKQIPLKDLIKGVETTLNYFALKGIKNKLQKENPMIKVTVKGKKV